MGKTLALNELDLGKSAYVISIENDSSMMRRLWGIGLIEGTEVECVGRSPFGDPSAYLIRGAVIAIRAQDAAFVKLTQECKA